MQINRKLILPHLVALLAFLAISLIYNSPLLKGKRLVQEDMTQVEGMVKELADYEAQHGTVPLWTNGLFGGMPSYQVKIEKPNIWVKHINTFLTQTIPQPASLFFILMLGFYILMLILRVGPLLSAIGAIAYALSSYNLIIIDVGHITKVMAMAYMAPCLAGLIMMYRGQLLKGALLYLLFFTLEVYVYHYQVTYYLGILFLIYGSFELYRAITNGQLVNFGKATGLAVGASIIAIMATFSSINITYQYQKETMRGNVVLEDKQEGKTEGLDKGYAFNWSYGIGETFTLMIPNFKGGASAAIDKKYLEDVDTRMASNMLQSSAYFGDQPGVAGPTYFGAIIIFLFLLAMLILENKNKWWMLASIILFTMLAWGDNFKVLSYLFFDYFPLYNKFRAVTIMLVLPALLMPVLGFLALKKWRDEKGIDYKKLYIAAGVTGGLCLLMYLMPGTFNSFLTASEETMISEGLKSQDANQKAGLSLYADSLEIARTAIFRADALRSFLFILLAFALLWLGSKGKFEKKYAVYGIALLIFIDLWGVGKRYLNEDDYVRAKKNETHFVATPADLEIQADQSHYRVLDLTVGSYTSNRASYFHKSLGGYHPAKLGRFEDLKVKYLIDSNERPINEHLGIIGMFNVKYFIYPGQNGALPQINPDACGNAWFVNEVKSVSSSREELDALEGLNTKTSAVVHTDFSGLLPTNLSVDPSARIELVSYAPDELVYKSQTNSDQLTIFSEVYFQDGWNATIDGQAVEHFRANYILRAMKVPAGESEIRFKFEPDLYYNSERISLIGSILLFGFLLGGLGYMYRQENSKKGKKKAA